MGVGSEINKQFDLWPSVDVDFPLKYCGDL